MPYVSSIYLFIIQEKIYETYSKKINLTKFIKLWMTCWFGAFLKFYIQQFYFRKQKKQSKEKKKKLFCCQH